MNSIRYIYVGAILLVMCLFTGCKDGIPFDEYNSERLRDHAIQVHDVAGTPVQGADVYLYFLRNDDQVLLSRQTTDDQGMVYYKESYLGEYTVEIGYQGSATKIGAGSFRLETSGTDRHDFEMPYFTEVSTQSITLTKEGLLANGEPASFGLLCTHPWVLEQQGDDGWLQASVISGDRGRYAIQLEAAPLSGAGRGIVYTVKPLDLTDVALPEVYVEQVGDPYLTENLDWLTALHTQPQNGDFLQTQTQTYMQGWGSDNNYRGWTRYNFPNASPATYSGLGYFKISTGSRGGGVISPKLTAIPGGTTDNVRLSFDVAKYIPASGTAGSGTVSIGIVGNGTFEDGTKTVTVQAENKAWNVFDTKSVVALNVDTDTQFVIRAPQVSGNHQFLLDNIFVTKAVFIGIGVN